MHEMYLRQANLLLRVLPHVMTEEVFALKGGTAINFFVRPIPRISVDIDLVYLPVKNRQSSIEEIGSALRRVRDRIQRLVPGSRVLEKKLADTATLFVITDEARIKIEPNLVIRGTVFPCLEKELQAAAAKRIGFDGYVKARITSFADLYGGKICAALDRQHPRDLFDIKLLLENEGLTNDVRQAFVVYLAGHNRPMHELLRPKLKASQEIFEAEFAGMTAILVTWKELEATQESLVSHIDEELSENERRFLLSIKQGEPEWDLINIPGIEQFPAIQWKLLNIRKMERTKHAQQVALLKAALKL